ncbi:MAG: hypothetical protein IJI92_02730 [Erysipelotrichaceae bacterium]|nr:hypothetical protein [Erysipelotrichaceae bacterium]
MEEKQIFRKKSIDRISSPEELNSYLRVTNPSVWIVLAAIIILLAGIIVWASVGELCTTAEAIVVSREGSDTVYVSGAKASQVKDGMTVVVEDKEAVIENVIFDEYGRAVGTIYVSLPDDTYKAEVIIERIRPIKFLIH